MLQAQNNIILKDVIIGKAEVSAPGSVTLMPGFHAKKGSNFHAFIGPIQGQAASATIEPSVPSSSPLPGSSGNNYIKTITYREATTSVPSGNFMQLEVIQYFDGLGRPLQTIQVGASPTGRDVIQPILYDSYGRESIKTLPYTGTKSGALRSGVSASTVNTYYSGLDKPEGIEADSNAYTLTVFDNSPLNLIRTYTRPGSAWTSRPVVSNYLTNSESITGWRVTDDYSYSSFSYSENTLYINETIDEDDNYSRDYKDKEGRVVLKETKHDTIWLQTAYIYDNFGLLRCVIPPEASGPEDSALCYYYLYDERKRMIEKKIPGGGTVKMVYDIRDRLRGTQNSEQAAVNEWSFIKYDGLNRPIMTGTIISANMKTELDAVSSLSETRNNIANNYGYTSISYPASGATILTATYYDDYDFISGMNLSDSLNSTLYDAGDYNFSSQIDLTPVGQVTGSMTRVFSSGSDNSCVPLTTLYSTNYYDKLGHLLRSISENHLKGKDVLSNLYEDITYLIMQNKQEHYKGPESIILEKWFEYDHLDRLLATSLKINNQPVITLNAMNYNEVGELITKYLHSTQTTGSRSFIQKTDYQYNIRGWMTKINDPGLGDNNDVFGMQLFYNGTSGMGSLSPEKGLFNGNITGIKWGIIKDPIRGYRFTYDNLNRIMHADYAEGSSLDADTGYYSEIIKGYDKNGNITGLMRYYNNILVDNLEYDYYNKSNELLKITDTGTSDSMVEDYPGTSLDYSYDMNGNMIFDGAKNFSIGYFRTLNLPGEIDFGGNNRIYYHYTSTGTKLVKHIVPVSGTETLTHYVGNIVYDGGTLSYILTEEGRLVVEGTGDDRVFLYEYSLKDHLGNNRVTFMGTDLGGAVDLVQTANYYPFGLVMSQTNGNTSPDYKKNLYLYNSKELQEDKMTSESLNWYDYGARFYDPQIVRWTTIDPAAELGRRWSPYTYTFDNPMRFTDPDGMWPNTNVLYGSIKKTLNEFASVKSQHPDWSNARAFGATILNRTADVASYTDLNDATVLTTWATRGDNAITIDSQKADSYDKAGAIIGVAAPLIGGKFAAKMLRGIDANRSAGKLREAAEKIDLENMYPDASVQGQHYLRDESGKIVKDPVTGEGRRVDFGVIQDGKAVDMVETTSQTANKNSQVLKENRIREAGGTYIRDRNTRELIDVSETPTRINRRY